MKDLVLNIFVNSVNNKYSYKVCYCTFTERLIDFGLLPRYS